VAPLADAFQQPPRLNTLQILDEEYDLVYDSPFWVVGTAMCVEKVLLSHGGLDITTSMSSGKAWFNMPGNMGIAYIGRRVSHPVIASFGSRKGELCAKAGGPVGRCNMCVWVDIRPAVGRDRVSGP
jgi:hypothetical protein